MNLQRLGIKLFCTRGDDIDLIEFIPVFHRWIQSRSAAQTLIDVADYSHVRSGPGVILVAHEGIFAMDEGAGRRGLAYYLRDGGELSCGQALLAVANAALSACSRLEQEPEFAGKLEFSAGEFAVFANDRLNAPNTDQSYEHFEPELRALTDRLYPGAAVGTEREADPKERFGLAVSSGAPLSVGAALERLSR